MVFKLDMTQKLFLSNRWLVSLHGSQVDVGVVCINMVVHRAAVTLMAKKQNFHSVWSYIKWYVLVHSNLIS